MVRRLNRGELFGYFPVEDYYRRGFDRQALLMNSGAPFGVFYAFNQDYDAADLYRVDVARTQIYRERGRWAGLPGFLSAFSAHTSIVEAGRMPSGFSAAGPRIDGRWIVLNSSAVPGIRFAPAVEEVGTPAEAYAAIRDDHRDLVARPVVETGRRAVRELSTGTFRVLLWAPDRIEVETRTPREARLILPRAWFPYRTIRIDGVAANAEAANFCLTSVSVPGGVHRISVREELPGGTAGPLLSLTAALLILFLALPRRRD